MAIELRVKNLTNFLSKIILKIKNNLMLIDNKEYDNNEEEQKDIWIPDKQIVSETMYTRNKKKEDNSSLRSMKNYIHEHKRNECIKEEIQKRRAENFAKSTKKFKNMVKKEYYRAYFLTFINVFLLIILLIVSIKFQSYDDIDAIKIDKTSYNKIRQTPSLQHEGYNTKGVI